MSLDCLAPPNTTRDGTEPHQHSGMCACTFQYSASDTDYCIHRRAYVLQQHNDDQPATNTGRQGNDQRISGFSDRRCLASPSTEHYQPEDQLQEIPRTYSDATVGLQTDGVAEQRPRSLRRDQSIEGESAIQTVTNTHNQDNNTIRTMSRLQTGQAQKR